jgi:hypothetical protein
MGEISRITELRSTQTEHQPSTAIHLASKDSARIAPEDASQLTKLSSVLNGLKLGANAMRAQVTHAMTAVRSGEYHVDPLQVSRSIVLDSMARR